ncbi:MAG: SPASM domain-containing protein [Prevotella histicola]|nr:SPASM domain-containing protein [Prevotella histicola]
MVGKYSKDGVKFFPNLEEIHSHNVSEKDSCSKCKFVFLCRGGCPQKAKTYSCKLVRELFKTSVNKVYHNNKKYFE